MNQKTLTLIIVLIILAVLGTFFDLWPKAWAPAAEEDQVVCTADAMQCPDGTWVGRTGPNCQFVCPGQ